LALLIDASVFIALERRAEDLSSLLERAGDESAAVAAITASELLHGVHRADGAVRRGRREAFVETILATLPVLPFTLDIARVHARLWADLQATGEMIGAHDLEVAATALTHELTVVSADRRHFGRIEGLELILW
jgi:tRNA(fMet)-specific endonuclease VapC